MALSDSSSRTWLGYVTAEVVYQCMTLCNDECLACKNGVISPLLHFHNELNLKDKIHRYLGRVDINLDSLFDQFILRFGWFALNRVQYIQLADIFLSVSTPEAIIYGKYITHQNDLAIYGQNESNDIRITGNCNLQPLNEEPPSIAEAKTSKRKATGKQSIKTKKSKKDAISQDAASRSDL